MARKKLKGDVSGPEALKDALVAILDDSKAEDIIVVPLAGKSTLADYMIIATGRSARHVSALAQIVGDHMKSINKSARYEGKNEGDWVLADTGDIIVHIFRPEVRSFYNLEKIWCAAEEDAPKARKRKA